MDAEVTNNRGYKLSFSMVVEDPRLTAEQARHVEHIAGEFSTRMATKYAKGQAEHGGNLFDLGAMDLLNEAIDEAVDQVVYLLTLRDKLRNFEKEIAQALEL